MRRHHRPRPKVSKRPSPGNPNPGPSAKPKPEPTFDYDGTLDVLRDNVARADAMLVTADELIVQLWSGGGSGSGDNLSLTRRKNHVSYLMEAARIAVRAAMHAGDELDLHRERS
jgi:hypothetical protein